MEKVKEFISSLVMQTQTGLETNPYTLKDNRLQQILQEVYLPEMLFQSVWHGSPKRFERFDSSHIGEGEGAQTYGWGLYFAGKKEVAEYYKEKLKGDELVFKHDQGTYVHPDSGAANWEFYPDDIGEPVLIDDDYDEYYALEALWEAKGNIADAYKIISNYASEDANINLEQANSFLESIKEGEQGQLYEVDIPGDEVMLDWDKPLGEQPEQVKEGLKKLFADELNENFTGVPESDGERLYREIVFEARKNGEVNPKRWASLKLNEYGIKGIRYLDQLSRGAGEGSYNYVIFDDGDINILNILFQMSREDIDAEALRYDSWRQWMEADVFAETQGWQAAFRLDDTAMEPRAREEVEAWYEKQWNEAQVRSREAALGDDGTRIPANAEAVNPELLDEETGSLDWDPGLYDEEAGVPGPAGPDGETEGTGAGNYKVLQEGIRDRGSEVMREAAGTMASVLETGLSKIVTHKKLGDITVDAGEAKSRSYGLRHIIKQRYDEGKSVKEISSLLILLNGTLKNGEKKRDIPFARQPGHRGRMKLDAGGIIAIVSKQRNQGDSEQWVLTGFDDKGSKEAADTIQKVISRYGYAPEFLGLEKQVGAVISSLSTVTPMSGEMSSGSSDSGNQKPITTSEANRRLAAKLPGVIDGFLTVMGQTMRANLAHFGAVTAEDVAIRDQAGRNGTKKRRAGQRKTRRRSNALQQDVRHGRLYGSGKRLQNPAGHGKGSGQ